VAKSKKRTSSSTIPNLQSNQKPPSSSRQIIHFFFSVVREQTALDIKLANSSTDRHDFVRKTKTAPLGSRAGQNANSSRGIFDHFQAESFR
jgi:hypothetical protein